jgi:hypothetical protein
MTRKAALLAFLALTACGMAPQRVTVPPVPVPERIASGFQSLEVLDVSLPDYAADDRIFIRDVSGALTPVPRAVWADDPERAVTLDLTRALTDLTGARVAPAPWPFDDGPEAQLDIRVAEIVADASGAFLMRGQYFVASRDGSGRDRARQFHISMPLAPDPSPAAIAAARGEATLALAMQIAEEGLR